MLHAQSFISFKFYEFSFKLANGNFNRHFLTDDCMKRQRFYWQGFPNITEAAFEKNCQTEQARYLSILLGLGNINSKM